MAVLMLLHQEFTPVPFSEISKNPPKKLENVLVNAVGFGGNAVSILLSRSQVLCAPLDMKERRFVKNIPKRLLLKTLLVIFEFQSTFYGY